MTQNRKTILIVEDDPGYRSVLVDKLTSEGFSILTAKDGFEGLNTALSKKPDLILLDLLMPKMGGLEFMNKLRADEWGNKAALIVLTNLDVDDEILANVLENHPAYYFVKPNFPLENVISKIKETLNIPV